MTRTIRIFSNLTKRLAQIPHGEVVAELPVQGVVDGLRCFRHRQEGSESILIDVDEAEARLGF